MNIKVYIRFKRLQGVCSSAIRAIDLLFLFLLFSFFLFQSFLASCEDAFVLFLWGWWFRCLRFMAVWLEGRFGVGLFDLAVFDILNLFVN
jgi:hypothetical protein